MFNKVLQKYFPVLLCIGNIYYFGIIFWEICIVIFFVSGMQVAGLQPRIGRLSTKSPDQRKHKCQFCTKSFFSISDCRRHERIHTGEKPFKCDVCGRSFNQKSNMENHRMQQHFHYIFGKDAGLL